MPPKRDVILATTLISTGMVGLAFSGQTKGGGGDELCQPAVPTAPPSLDCPDIGCNPTAKCNENSLPGGWSEGDCVEGGSICEESTNNDQPTTMWKCTQVDCEIGGTGGPDGKTCSIVDTGKPSGEEEDGVNSCNGT